MIPMPVQRRAAQRTLLDYQAVIEFAETDALSDDVTIASIQPA